MNTITETEQLQIDEQTERHYCALCNDLMLAASSTGTCESCDAERLVDRTPDSGVWFQSAVSGLWYQNHRAAGDLRSVKVNGVRFIPVVTGTYQCDACGKIVPADEVKSALPTAGVEGTFCHECRHGKNCDCNAQ